jgi:hypothetical protein
MFTHYRVGTSCDFSSDLYKNSYTWFESAIMKFGACGISQTHTTYGSGVAHKHVQCNCDSDGGHDAYHFIAWDIRYPAAEVQEWLETVETGDVVTLYPPYRLGYMNLVSSVGMTLYWEK